MIGPMAWAIPAEHEGDPIDTIVPKKLDFLPTIMQEVTWTDNMVTQEYFGDLVRLLKTSRYKLIRMIYTRACEPEEAYQPRVRAAAGGRPGRRQPRATELRPSRPPRRRRVVESEEESDDIDEYEEEEMEEDEAQDIRPQTRRSVPRRSRTSRGEVILCAPSDLDAGPSHREPSLPGEMHAPVSNTKRA